MAPGIPGPGKVFGFGGFRPFVSSLPAAEGRRGGLSPQEDRKEVILNISASSCWQSVCLSSVQSLSLKIVCVCVCVTVVWEPHKMLRAAYRLHILNY